MNFLEKNIKLIPLLFIAIFFSIATIAQNSQTQDTDGDGILDFWDNCFNVHDPTNTCTGSSGGNPPVSGDPNSQTEDTDGDGIINFWDNCFDVHDPSNTCTGSSGGGNPPVTGGGDPNSQTEDTDGDGIINFWDNCFDVHDPSNTCTGSSGGSPPVSGGGDPGSQTEDTDGDGIINFWDNCFDVHDPSNTCTGSGGGSPPVSGGGDPNSQTEDTDGDGIINFWDNCFDVHDPSNTCSGSGGGDPPSTNINFLKDYPTPNQSACGMYIGAATPNDFSFFVNGQLDNNLKNQYKNAFAADFNMAVPENGMKMQFVRNSQNGPNNYEGLRQSLDAYVLGGGNENKKVRGHTICWHGGSPNYGGKDNTFMNSVGDHTDTNNPQYLVGLTTDQLRDELIDYVTDLVNDTKTGKYSGKFESWDVINEAIRGDGSGFRTFQPTTSRNNAHINGISCVWERLGYETQKANGHPIPKYIKIAFDAAANAAPANQALIYNDWGAEYKNSNKAKVQFQMLQALKNQLGTRIDGVGFQCHFELGEITNRINEFEQNIVQYINAGYDVYFTEVDIRIPNNASAGQITQQANEYKALMNLALKYDGIKAFVLWGVSDKYSWVSHTFPGKGNALLLDNNFGKKTSYDSVLQALKDKNCSSSKLNNDIANFKSNIFTAYPNPFDKTIQIDLEESNGEMKIYDMTGRTVLSQKIDRPQTSLNTQNLKAGYYLIEVERKGKIARQKIIKH